MTNPHRKLSPLIAAGIFAGLFNAAKKRWKSASVFGKVGWAAVLGGALGLIVALFLRAFK